MVNKMINLVCKKNSELSMDEVIDLFNIYYKNILPYIDKYKKDKEYSTIEYKNNWINYVINRDNLLCFKYYDDNKLIGFIVLRLLEEETYISDFNIIEEYQDDGYTFKEMIKLAFPKCPVNKKITGRILAENHNARLTFSSLGAVLRNKKFVISYEQLRKWIENNN